MIKKLKIMLLANILGCFCLQLHAQQGRISKDVSGNISAFCASDIGKQSPFCQIKESPLKGWWDVGHVREIINNTNRNWTIILREFKTNSVSCQRGCDWILFKHEFAPHTTRSVDKGSWGEDENFIPWCGQQKYPWATYEYHYRITSGDDVIEIGICEQGAKFIPSKTKEKGDLLLQGWRNNKRDDSVLENVKGKQFRFIIDPTDNPNICILKVEWIEGK